jgi:hypothetical protein
MLSANRAGNGSERKTKTGRQRNGKRARFYRLLRASTQTEKQIKHALAVVIPFLSLRSFPLPEAAAGEATLTTPAEERRKTFEAFITDIDTAAHAAR